MYVVINRPITKISAREMYEICNTRIKLMPYASSVHEGGTGS